MRSMICALMCLLICGCARLPVKNLEAQPEEPLLPPTPTQIESRQYYNQAQYWISRGNWVKGEQLCWQALHTLKDTDPGHAHGAMRNNLVRPMLMNGKIDEAIEMGQSALEWNLKTKDPVGIACSYINLGDAYDRKGDIEQRDAYWEKARVVAAEHHLTESMKYIKPRLRMKGR